MPETYTPLSKFTVHAWMPERMGLQYPELYVYALFHSAGDEGIPATKSVTRDMARLCGISETTFYRVRNRLMLMGLLFTKSFSGSERIYYVTDRDMPLPIERRTKEKQAPSVTRTIADAENISESDTAAEAYENDKIADMKPFSDAADIAAEKFSQNIKEIVAGLRASTDTVLYSRDRLIKRLQKYGDTFSDAWDDVTEMIEELTGAAEGYESFGEGPAPEGESGLFEGTAGDMAAKGSDEGSHIPDAGISLASSIAAEIGKLIGGILGEGDSDAG